METTKENIVKAHSIAREAGEDNTCKVLEALYPDIDFTPKDNRPVTERIKTFEDACAALGEDNHLVQQYRFNYNDESGWYAGTEDFEAYLKLRIITAALNEGWEPQFTQDEERWFPWHILWTEEELASKDEEWKRDRRLTTMQNHRGEWAGLAFACSDHAPSLSGAHIGSRLCFKSDTLAEYAGKQFIDLWMDFYLIRK